MRSIFVRGVAFLIVFAFVSTPVWATCGGGGGGGGGGMSGSGSNSGSNPVVYHVPWKTPAATKSKPPTEGLVLYWFPASKTELQNSSLRESRNLSLYASQCVTMQLADMASTKGADALVGESKLPVTVLATPDGTTVAKLENTNGKLKVVDVEKLVAIEVRKREVALDAKLKDAKAKAGSGETKAAIELYKSVAVEKCMFAKKAKTAASELKKLGEQNVGSISASPNFDPKTSDLIQQTMKRGLIAENAAKYELAEKLYSQARTMDPADPTPLRYLAELHRHHIGDWDRAKAEFHQILDMQADPLSRAVALHGLGKITIHEGEFKKGLHLMEESVETYPITLAYRNLAVYWHSEYDLVKGTYYTDHALAMDPEDPYNIVFSAVFMAANGKKDEALKIAMANIDLLPASYNLAAIFALNGQRDKALELLKRHFYEFERYHAVREKEMMEARVDAVFASIVHDKDFLELTKFADGKLPMVMSPRQASPMRMDH